MAPARDTLLIFEICLLLFGTVLTTPSDEFRNFVDEGELGLDDSNYVQHIVPSGYPPQKSQEQPPVNLTLADIVGKENMYYDYFLRFYNAGCAMKGLTFNLYNDDLRQTAMVLFKLLKDSDESVIKKAEQWAKQYINDNMFLYVKHLLKLYSNQTETIKIEPLFISKPHHFVNGETIVKALNLKANQGNINDEEAEINQIYKTAFYRSPNDNVFVINTNYSGWNTHNYDCNFKRINYFTEDISLNSYYYGIHLLHPFWMGDAVLSDENPRHAEHYYFSHQQLVARYNLEKEHLIQNNISINDGCGKEYYPYLMYENGLPFAIRSTELGEWSADRAHIKSVDITIKECLSRGYFIMENGTKINLTEDNHINILAKLIRANVDSVKTAKITRSIFGYGGSGYPIDTYNPAPTVMHHPETSLRDPAYWYMIKDVLNYVTEFQKSLDPYDLSKFETDDFRITELNYEKMATKFEYYQFKINEGIYANKKPFEIAALQKRLNSNLPTIVLKVESSKETDVIVRLFIGPQCYIEKCWESYSSFFLIDAYKTSVVVGENELLYDPNNSSRFSFDIGYGAGSALEDERSRYNIFKFPHNLIIPRGLSTGLKLTLFAMITPADEIIYEQSSTKSYYNQVVWEVDSKPLGFPFHRPAMNYKYWGSNYKFYNISVCHKRGADFRGYFSTNLS